jgi:hypothetical protein
MSKERKSAASGRKGAVPIKREPTAAERRAIEQARNSHVTLPARCELSMKVEGNSV